MGAYITPPGLLGGGAGAAAPFPEPNPHLQLSTSDLDILPFWHIPTVPSLTVEYLRGCWVMPPLACREIFLPLLFKQCKVWSVDSQ